MNLKNKTTTLVISTLFIGYAHAAGGFGETLLQELGKEILKPITQQQSKGSSSTQTNTSQNSANDRMSNNTELYSGPPRWPVGPGMVIEKGADASVTVAVKLHANPKASPKISARDFFSLLKLDYDSNREFWFKTAQGQEVRPHLLQCHYIEALDPHDVRSYRLPEVRRSFWTTGTRIALHETMKMNYEQYSEQIIDTEVEACPENLALAIEAGYGPGVWSEIEPKFQKNFSANIKSSIKFVNNGFK